MPLATNLPINYANLDPGHTAAHNLVNGRVNDVATQVNTNTTDIATLTSGKQPLDSDLTAFAALTPSNDDIAQRKAGAWTNRTMAQLKTDLVLAKADVGLGNVDNTSDANKPVSTATQTALDLKRAIIPRVVTLTAASNIYTPNADTTDKALMVTPAANFTVAAPTGTPVNGQQLKMQIRSDATGRTPTWNAIFISSGIAALPTTALPASKTVTLGFEYDTTNSKWVLLAADLIGY